MVSRAPPGAGIAFGLFGAGGFGREVMPIAQLAMEKMARETKADRFAVYFVDRDPQEQKTNIPVVSEAAFLELQAKEKFFNIAIADPITRRRLADDLCARGLKPLSIIAPNSTIYDGNDIGDGAIICANTTITSNARIGRFCHLNIYSYVAHDCVVGDFVTFAPRVNCNGNVHVGESAYIGTSAMIRQGAAGKPLYIGAKAIVGMGAVVTRDVPPNATVVGNPARIVETAEKSGKSEA
jgi:sugar O-acyltransferase (sialic acid O-acetyltransferase NeuD family)